MKKKLSGLYYLIPVIYVAVIGVFIYMQFQSGERFEEKVGTLTISGTYARSLTGARRLRGIEVRMNDLRLPIDSSSPILAGFGEVREKKIQALSHTVLAEGLEIECEEGLLLRFELGGATGQVLTLHPVIPNTLGTLSTLSFPFHLEEEQGIQGIPGIPLFELTGRVGRWYVALPAGSTIDGQSRRLVLRAPAVAESAAGRESPEVDFERLESPQEPYVYWFSREAALAGSSRFGEELGGFLDAAYRQWSRVAAEQPVNPALAGQLGISLLSESVRRNQYRTMQALVARGIRQILREDPEARIDYAGACYLGDLPSFLRWRQAEALEELSLLTELIRRADLSLFATPQLIAFIVNHAPFSLAEEALRLADSVDLEREALIDVLNITGSYLEALDTLRLGETTLRRIALAVEKRILPAIRAAGGELYFVLDPGGRAATVDLFTSAQAGVILREAGRQLQRPAYEELGRNLILAVLRRADAAGSVPARGRLDSEGLAPEAERIPPEQLYRLVAQELYTPEEYPLYAFLYPGSWILTASQLAEVQIDPNRHLYRFSFPAAQTHYVLIQGVRPPESLAMHGIPWKTDPQYFLYSDGWAYVESTQSLFIKLTHRAEVEEIVLGY